MYDTSYFDTHFQGRDWTFYTYLVSAIVRHSSPGPILDMGCGLGLFVEAATRWGMDCVGVEGSIAAIESATGRMPALRITQGDLGSRLPFDNSTFRTVTLNQVIEHLPGTLAENAVREALRVLQPGGTFMVWSPSPYDKVQVADPTHINLFTPSRLRGLLESSGFEAVVSDDEPLLNGGRFVRRVLGLGFKLSRWERLSATAICRAVKPFAAT
jgi:SAM-dependent methyltransferase